MYYAMDEIENFRDLGGIDTYSGHKVQNNRLFRCGEMTNASFRDLEKIRALGIDTIVDLRNDKERAEKPDPVIKGVTYINLPFNSQKSLAGVERDKKSKATFYEKMFENSKTNPNAFLDYMKASYNSMLTDEYSRNQIRKFLKVLADDSHQRILWHCASGKDRTGVAAVMILEVLGARRDQIRENYLDTNKYLGRSTQEVVNVALRMGEGRDDLDQIVESFRTSMRADDLFFFEIYDSMAAMAGAVADYLSSVLGLTDEEIISLRQKYLEKKLNKSLREP